MTCSEHDQETCEPVRRMADRWLIDYAQHARATASAVASAKALSAQMADLAPKVERAIVVCTVLEARYPVLKEMGEATLHETVNARLTADRALAKAEESARAIATSTADRVGKAAGRRAVRGPAWAMVAATLFAGSAAWYSATHTQAQASPGPSVPALSVPR